MRPAIRWLMLSAGMFLLGAVLASSRFVLPTTDKARGTEADWRLPAITGRQALEESYSRLIMHYQSDSVETGRDSVSWQLHGISMEGGQYFALIKHDQKVGRFQENDQLPDGTLLTKIDQSGIGIDTAAGPKQIQLYNPQAK